jgi:prepilin-type N-terminal cleavage/methylation domain-containing protein
MAVSVRSCLAARKSSIFSQLMTEDCDNKTMKQGFSLAELLITLAILGIISVFTIPKLLQGQQDSTYRANAKQAVSALQAAYQAYRYDNTVTAATKAADILPYLKNYVKIENSGDFDETPGSWQATCGSVSGDGTLTCYRLHSGAILEATSLNSFNGTATTNAVYFYLDPDGKYSGTTNGPGKSVVFFLYTDGKIKSWGNVYPNTTSGSMLGTYNPTPANDPTWWSWD